MAARSPPAPPPSPPPLLLPPQPEHRGTSARLVSRHGHGRLKNFRTDGGCCQLLGVSRSGRVLRHMGGVGAQRGSKGKRVCRQTKAGSRLRGWGAPLPLSPPLLRAAPAPRCALPGYCALPARAHSLRLHTRQPPCSAGGALQRALTRGVPVQGALHLVSGNQDAHGVGPGRGGLKGGVGTAQAGTDRSRQARQVMCCWPTGSGEQPSQPSLHASCWAELPCCAHPTRTPAPRWHL